MNDTSATGIPTLAGPRKPRLSAFEVRNFRVFKHSRIEVHPSVTVLVGLNDVGKSTLLDAMRAYGIIAQRSGFRGPLSDDEFSGTGELATQFCAEWKDHEGNRWTHALTLDANAPEERLVCGSRFWSWNPKARTLETHQGSFDAKDMERYAALAQLSAKRWQLDTEVPPDIYEPLGIVQFFRTPEAYLFEPSALGRPAPISMPQPSRNGAAWGNWLQEIINRRNDDIKALENDIRALFPFFSTVTVRERRVQIHREVLEIGADSSGEPRPLPSRPLKNKHSSGSVRIATDRGDMLDQLSEMESTREVLVDIAAPSNGGNVVRVPASGVSSGLLLALCHFSLLHASPEHELLFLEEPENGLNGEVTLQMIRSFLRVVTQRNQQLILTTHHPFWLDLVDPESIRVLVRDEEGAHILSVAEEIRQAREDDVYASEIMGTFGPNGLLRTQKRAEQ